MVRVNGIEYRASDDGKTHINIYSGGKTELGRFLSNFASTPVQTKHGAFASLEGYYHWRRLYEVIDSLAFGRANHLRDISVLRDLVGTAAQQAGRKLRTYFRRIGITTNDIPSQAVRDDFKEALIAKVKQHDMVDVLVTSTLPFTHYYCYKGGLLHYEKHYNWLSDLAEELRDELTEEVAKQWE